MRLRAMCFSSPLLRRFATVVSTSGSLIRVPGVAGGVRRASNPWDRFYRFQEAPWRGERPVADLVPLLGEGPVLELGVGNGKLLRPLVAAGVDVVGLDLSWNVLRRLGAGVLADASVLPFRDCAFSAVLDVHCSGHLLAAGRAAAAQEAWRVLRPGGVCVVERLAPDDLRAASGEVTEQDTRRLVDGRSTHFSDESDLRSEREAAGFLLESLDSTRRTPRLRGQQVVRSSVRGVFRRP